MYDGHILYEKPNINTITKIKSVKLKEENNLRHKQYCNDLQNIRKKMPRLGNREKELPHL